MFTKSPDTSDSDYGSREFSAFSSPISSSVPSSSNQNVYGTKRNVERKRQRYYGIPPITPVDFVDFLKKDSYNPKTFVKPSHAVNENMKTIANLRQQNPEDFKNLDDRIKEYHHENVQTKTMFEHKMKALEILKGILPIYDREQRFHICGSTMTGLGTNDSDMDICWVIPVFSNKCSKPTYPTSETNGFDPFIILMKAHKLIEKLLRHTKYPFVNIRRARVSILRFTMLVDDQKIRVDININNIAGIYNTFMLAHYAKIDKRFSMLAMVIKAWGLQAEIIDPVNGYLNTYTVYLMILHFLQCGVSPPVIPNLVGLRHDLFDGTLDLHKVAESFDFDLGMVMDESNDIPVGDLLIGFLRYYAFFNFQHDGIFIRLACIDQKKTEDEFFIEEVYDRITVPKNLTKRKLKFIKTSFLDAYLGQHDSPDFENFIYGKRTFLRMN